MIEPNGLLKFKVTSWLSGFEYAFLIRHYRAYLEIYPGKFLTSQLSHPPEIYEKPKGSSHSIDFEYSWLDLFHQGLAPKRIWFS